MSENLKRLREEDKKIAEKFIRKHALPHWHERYYPLAGMSQIEELERKAGEARKEEQRVKEEIKREEEKLIMEREEMIREFMKRINRLLQEEKSGIVEYEELINVAKTLGPELSDYTTPFLKHIILEEKRHADDLQVMLNTIGELKFALRPKHIPPLYKRYE